MLYHLALKIKPYLPIFNVIQYVSFRAIAGLLSSLMLTIIGGWWFIAQSERFRCPTRHNTPDAHRTKGHMPTMGGVCIIGATLLAMVIWCRLDDPMVWLFMLLLVGFGAVGLLDDMRKIAQHEGISARSKFLLQCVVAVVVGSGLLYMHKIEPSLHFPFFKQVSIGLGPIFLLWIVFVLVGGSNAVNLTDGLDGLAIGSLLPNFATFTLIAYLAGHKEFAAYLYIPYTQTHEVAVIGAILMGSSMGFLWYNAYPAQVFMGDVGSLALGASLAYMALVCKQEVLLVVSGGLFVFETISVISQVLSRRIFKRRLFRMAPIHHHFELLGWPESRITARFGIISCVLCLIALMTLKLR